MALYSQARKEASLPIRASTLFEMFPFCLLFQKDKRTRVQNISFSLENSKIGNIEFAPSCDFFKRGTPVEIYSFLR